MRIVEQIQSPPTRSNSLEAKRIKGDEPVLFPDSKMRRSRLEPRYTHVLHQTKGSSLLDLESEQLRHQ